MLIKEYRICLPLSVAEYRIAQLYMIQKKCLDESNDKSSGVEILKNEPYTDGPGGDGQYTYKIYRIGSHLPGWLYSLLPSSALRVEEEAWNAYPYTRTIFKLSIMEKLTMDIETYYFDDAGERDDVFKLSPQEKSARVVDFIDLVTDPLGRGEYKEEEDPLIYMSQATGRGPLTHDWRSEYAYAQRVTHELHSRPPTRTPDNRPIASDSQVSPLPKRIMCAYKLCRVEFRYWGFQSRIENFIHDTALRKVMVRAHRQVWAWQDEWYGLTLQEIRKLEEKTARRLAEKLNQSMGAQDGGNESSSAGLKGGTLSPSSHSSNIDDAEVDTHTAVSLPKNEQIWHSLSRLAADNYSARAGAVSHYEPDAEDDDSDTASFVTCRSFSPDTAHPVGRTLDDGDDNPSQSKARDTLDSDSKCMAVILVVHGGCLLDVNSDEATKRADMVTLLRTVNMVAASHYPLLHNRIAIRLLTCPTGLLGIFDLLTKIKTSPVDPNAPIEVQFARDVLPLGSIPLFMTESVEYTQLLQQLASQLNCRYAEFLQSREGQHFSGPVYLVGDSLGALLTFDVLSSQTTMPPSQTDIGARRWRRPMSNSWTSPGLSSRSNGSDRCSSCETLAGEEKSDPDDTPSERHAERSMDLDFHVNAFFALGSPLGLLLAYRRQQGRKQTLESLHIAADQVYNLFHPLDFCGFRLEPLLVPSFLQLPPISLARYHRYPLGDGAPITLVETIVRNPQVFADTTSDHMQNALSSTTDPTDDSSMAVLHSEWERTTCDTLNALRLIRRRWWGGQLRLDYSVHCPPGIQALLFHVRPTIFHASYWESCDVAAFILRQLMEFLDMPISGTTYAVDLDDHVAVSELTQLACRLQSASPTGHPPRDRSDIQSVAASCASKPDSWQSPFAGISRHPKSNHRANDVIALITTPQVISARFTFGILDILPASNEKVELQVCSASGAFKSVGTGQTDSTGRLRYRIPEDRCLDVGLHKLMLTAEKDPGHPVQVTLAVVPPRAEVVIFSIDGSFVASLSIMGKDAKVRPGSVDVARHWQSLGFLLIYLSARPDIQQRRVTRWLSDHNFPRGIIYFVDRFSTDPLRHKMQLIVSVVQQNQLNVHCAYGSGKDVTMYRALGLPALSIYAVGRLSQSQASHATRLTKGYARHLSEIRDGHASSRQAVGSISTLIRYSTLAYSPLI